MDRSELHQTTVHRGEPAQLEDGQARLSISAFGLSANNITYAAFGDMLGYWNFFPSPITDESTNWGRVPVWGFADVAESRNSELEVGERVYGYLPMSTELVVRPGKVSPGSFVDLSDHRAALPATYNRYARCAGDPGYDEHFEDEQMLLRPLFFTSFLIDDFLEDNAFFGASTVIATSASSKTAFGTAHLLSQRPDIHMVGLTSAGNVDFVDSLECYDTVLRYDEIHQLATAPAALIDFAGNAAVVRSVHEHFQDELKHSAVIGGTHWDAERGANEPLPGPAPAFFFAPTQIEKRHADWGAAQLEQRLADAWLPFIERVNGWIDVKHDQGPDAVSAAYLEMLAGNTSPNTAIVLSP